MVTKRLLFVGGGTCVFGLEKVVLRLVKGLAERGYDIFCTVSGWNNGDYPTSLARIGVPYEEIFLGWYYLSKPAWTLDSLLHAPVAFAAYGRLLKTFRPDLVFHSSYRSLALLGRMVGRKNVIVIQDYWPKAWENWLVRWCDNRVRTYVAPSNDIRSRLIAAGLPARKVERVYNPAEFGEVLRRVPPARRKNLPTVGLVGQIIARKGHHVVIEAMARIRERFPGLEYRLKVFGTGPDEYVNRVKELAAARGVAPLIEWCGYKTNVDEIYPEIDFTLVPTTTTDPLPLAAIEPAVYGKPVIASATGGLPEIVRDGVTGFLVPPGDPDALADRIVKLIKDPDLVRALGARAYADYKSQFDEAVFIDQYCHIIEALIGR